MPLTTVLVAVGTRSPAVGVGVGALVAIVAFARRVAHTVDVERTVEERVGEQIAEHPVSGGLFFASSDDLHRMIDYAGDLWKVVLGFHDSHRWDASTVAARAR